ncbi:N-acetylmuramoyl-L-alanine amidase family protein [Paenibacillus sp. IHBB 10380]|uniref:N-acetylmuramoyl-L-alanine amidase family protein n=1 Tax=Paenibacillus sp. IHBB 10380 TaxID=1566358 RepID=UPI0005CFB618|nr:N-acetylmuramoyl-L-alanine amidase family protein [Paenibacillus sp. IHBB 10380]AJS58112.1 N-acetylmuramoyl-L-alanine amidase [Paenibacillus sp. IHBB 10380]
MKKFSFLLLVLIFVMVFPSKGQAATANSNIFLDGKELTLTTNAKIENVKGNIMIPIRVVTENLGFQVGWEKKTGTVTIQNDSKTVKLVVDSKTATVNGNEVALEVSPLLRSDTVLVPIRFVSEEMGLLVSWDNASKTVRLITSDNGSGNTTPPDNGNSNEGLAMINGLSFSENRLLIATSGNIQPKISTLTGPDRIVIDVPNAAFGDTFGQQLDQNLQGEFAVNGYPDVSKIRYSLFNNAPSTVRIVVDMNYSNNYTLTNDGSLYIVNIDTADTKPTPPVGGNGKKIVVIDAGHGNQDPGATGITGKREKDFNLAVALKVEKLLKKEPNIEFVLTRSNDTFLELKQRVKIANDLKADVFVSIHANSSGSSVATGTETYYQRESSKSFANIMHKYLVKATGLKDRGVRYGNFHVIRETKMAAVLLEVGYLSNKNDESALFNETFQNNVAEGVVKGIKEYLQIK